MCATSSEGVVVVCSACGLAVARCERNGSFWTGWFGVSPSVLSEVIGGGAWRRVGRGRKGRERKPRRGRREDISMGWEGRAGFVLGFESSSGAAWGTWCWMRMRGLGRYFRAKSV
jgi:hypothetical protein